MFSTGFRDIPKAIGRAVDRVLAADLNSLWLRWVDGGRADDVTTFDSPASRSGVRWWFGDSRRVRRPWRAIPASLVCVALAASDAIAIMLAGFAAMLAYGDLKYLAQAWPNYLVLSLGGAAGMLLLGSASDLYRRDVLSTPFMRPWRAAACWAATVLVLLGAVFFFRPGEPVSRGWISVWFVLSAGSFGLVRLVVRMGIARWRSNGRMRRRVVIIGPSTMAAELAARFNDPARRDFYHVEAVFSDHNLGHDANGAPLQVETPFRPDPHLRHLSQADAVVPFIRDRAIETVFVGFNAQPTETINSIVRELTELPVEVLFCPDCSRFALPVMHAHLDGELPLLLVSRPPLGEWARIVKRLEDCIIGSLMLVALGPAMLLAAAAIKLDSPGPVLFRQLRFGFNNRPISVVKFRSMHTDLGDPTGAKRTVLGDRRVTRVGRVLRATSIDELPQLFNVLRGEMSLVGPRAHPVMMKVIQQFYHEAVDGYAARHRVKPGITGLAQINGCRGEVDTMEKALARVRYDLEYVARWSLWLDFKIMLLTPIRALHKGY